MASKLILLLSLLSLASFSLVTCHRPPRRSPPPRMVPTPSMMTPPPMMAPPPRSQPPMMAPPPRSQPPMMVPPPRNPPPMMAPPPRRQPPMMVSPPRSNGICPKNTLQLRVCVGLLNSVGGKVGTPPLHGSTRPCCSLIAGLVDLQATVCLCQTLKAHLLQIVDVNLTVSLALKVCNRNIPPKAIKCPK
ncbi:PREDICTED: lipid transfer protein EARLI 1-like [Ipomoea nil]|uniref:lipid transfer protein EARLI 1-like n=1 Tax=Ipomoea nil TaxID=35883 RepID=UPI000900C333|nr:PREDICTED: lipid transfer protein EARLI 1-like [Ipomoea nil]